MKWQAARDEEMDVTVRAALCQAETQEGRSDTCFELFWKAALRIVSDNIPVKGSSYAVKAIIAQEEWTGFSSEM